MSYHISVLQDELLRRQSKNSSYSIRAFARNLGVHSSSLSRILTGKMVFSYSIAQRIVGRLGLSLDEQRRFLKSLSDAHHTKFDKKLGQLGTKVERAGARAAEQELGFDDAVMVDERSLQEVRSKITSFLKDMKSLGPSAGVDQCYRVSVEVGASIESIRSQ